MTASHGFALTDAGNAERFVARHGHEVRHLADTNRWLVWKEGVWCEDPPHLQWMWLDTVRSIATEATPCDGGPRALRAFAASSESARAKRNMLALAGDLEPVHCSTALFDRDPWVLGCPNGVVDLRTGNFRPGKPTDLVSHTTVAPYDPEAQAPRFMRALEQLACGNVELITYLQRIFGLCLTGTVDARSLFILYGPTGANGKTTIVEAFAHMLGDYAQHAPHELLLVHRNGGATPDIARLAGARFVTMSEAPTSSSFNEVTLKQLTGGDTITARHLFRNHQQLTPTWTLMMLANNLPAVKEPGNAMWDRLKIVPCDNRIKPADRKPDLAARLRREAAGILAWAVRGAADYARNGLGRCDAVDEATDEFRRDSEPLLTFIEDCCLVDDGAFTTTKDLHDRYRQWVGPSPSMSMTTFSGRLKTLHHSGRNGRIAGKPSGFFGISLR